MERNLTEIMYEVTRCSLIPLSNVFRVGLFDSFDSFLVEYWINPREVRQVWKAIATRVVTHPGSFFIYLNATCQTSVGLIL